MVQAAPSRSTTGRSPLSTSVTTTFAPRSISASQINRPTLPNPSTPIRNPSTEPGATPASSAARTPLAVATLDVPLPPWLSGRQNAQPCASRWISAMSSDVDPMSGPVRYRPPRAAIASAMSAIRSGRRAGSIPSAGSAATVLPPP